MFRNPTTRTARRLCVYALALALASCHEGTNEDPNGLQNGFQNGFQNGPGGGFGVPPQGFGPQGLPPQAFAQGAPRGHDAPTDVAQTPAARARELFTTLLGDEESGSLEEALSKSLDRKALSAQIVGESATRPEPARGVVGARRPIGIVPPTSEHARAVERIELGNFPTGEPGGHSPFRPKM